MRRFGPFWMSVVLFSVLLSTSGRAADWPQWRGLQRDGTSPETGLLKSWPEGGPPLVMRIDGLGEGITSVAVVKDRIYTLSEVEEESFAIALNRTTGERLWATSLGPAGRQIRLMRWLSQRTPTVDGDRIFAITAAGQLSCLDITEGTLLWQKNYEKDYRGSGRPWGFCDYPLVDGDRLICKPGGEDATLVALNKLTGEEIWRIALPNSPRPAHSATLKGTIDGIKFYIAFLSDGLYGLAADDGRVLWRYDKNSRSTANSHTPLLLDDHVFTSNGYGTGIALLKLSASNGDISAEEVYFKRMALDAFQDNSLPLGDEAVLVERTGAVFCLNRSTGEPLWMERTPGRGRGAMILADGRLYRRSSSGLVSLMTVDQEDPEFVGQFELPDTERQAGGTSPVISDGRLYIRDNDRLFVYDIRDGAKAEQRDKPLHVKLPPFTGMKSAREPRVPYPIYLPTPHDIVAKMLEESKVNKETTLVDLGSGDGRIVIAAAKNHGAKAIGYEIDEELIGISRNAIAEQKLEKLARIEGSDMYKADLSEVDVVAVFLYPAVLEKLKPQFAKMKPGTRIISHQFPIPGIEPAKELMMTSEETGQKHRILLYRLPLKEQKDK